MSKFRVGDKVKCITLAYPDWCNVEMVVQSTKNDAWIYCSHPKKGVGMFREGDLVKVTEEKPSSLELQKQELLKQIEQIDKQIADKKLEEQKKLGEKEVEIKLTLNELALLVADTGVQNTHSAKDNLEGLGFNALSGLIEYIEDGGHTKLYAKLNDLYIGSIK